MPWACCVPNCTKRQLKCKQKCSTFKVPSDETLRNKWIASIPGVQFLRSTQRICELHFTQDVIVRETIKYDGNRNLLAKVPLKYPRLQETAVPTLFVESPLFRSCQRSEEAVQSNVTENQQLNVQTDFTANCHETNSEALSCTSLNEREENMQIADPGNEKECMEFHVQCHSNESLQCIPRADDNGSVSSSNSVSTTVSFDSVTFVFNAKLGDDTLEKNEGIPVALPKPWNVCRTIDRGEETLVFTYPVNISNNGCNAHIFEKTVVLKSSGEIEYEVYSTPANIEGTKLPQLLNNIKMLPGVLMSFKDMRICKGIEIIDLNIVPRNAALKTCNGTIWRTENCPLLSINKERCTGCRLLTRTWSQKLRRLEKKKSFQRVPKPSNPVDQTKMKALQKKMKQRTRTAYRLKHRLHLLTNSIAEQQSKVARITDNGLEFKCSSLDIPGNQKILIKEIISAAQTDVRGRRYSDEFIMLCMLMNIRSQSYYEFLRKNDVIPLPCTRTIRDYLSLMGSKCGFDENFFKLLEKSFRAKDVKDCHGVLILDEITLRKSIAVSSKTLTYTGLTDFGEDGPKSSDTADLATHGLVLMYQSIKEKYTQPIAVFASKNAVVGEELAKLVLKAICFLEKAGTLIHGVIADGASTNRKMWKTLNVHGTLGNTKSSFTHPLDDDRRVFMFSDTPHLIKCIRNRLHNKGSIRVNPEDSCVKWEYFVKLFEVDNSQPGNARVCPRLSRRHIDLDNTAKMRVRFATQIFSNSVAIGLQFYLAQKYAGFKDCEATIDFCKRINNIFDAFNRKQPNEGLTPESHDFKLLEEALEWLNQWESRLINNVIQPYEFLTTETAHGLRVTITSTLDLCRYLIQKYDFKYLLSGKVNQDNLEKFFGTIRQAAGSNEHRTCPTFLQLYKLLSVYSVIKPPKYGNCTLEEKKYQNVITVTDIKEIFKRSESRTSTALKDLKTKLDEIIKHEDWEAHEVIEHDYSLSPVLDCIIYYVTGYLCKQVFKKQEFNECKACKIALIDCEIQHSVTQLVNMKTRGGLIHANEHFFNLINFTEKCFSKHSSNLNVFDLTLDEVLDKYEFTYPCKQHASDILAYALFYYIRLRMRQYTYQENLKVQKKFVVQRKMSKLVNV